jgi:flagellin-like protein
MRYVTTKCRTDGIEKEDEEAVSPVIGVILMVSITVTVAATAGAFLLDPGLVSDVEQPATSGVTFNYDYDDDSDKMKVSVQTPGNVERIYIANRDGGFDDADIVETTGGWLKGTADRDAAGRIVNGSRVVNEDVDAGDKIVLDNVTMEDELVLTADRGSGTDENLLSYWENDDWSYTG